MKLNKLVNSLLMLVSVVFLAACGNSAESSNEGSSTSSDGPIEIEYWYGLGSVAGETMEEIIADFNESQDNYHVTGVQQPDYSSTWEAVQAAMAGGNAPAVWLGYNEANAGEDGIYANLNDLYETEEFASDELIPAFVEEVTVDGNRYAVPIWGTTQVMYYNQNVYDEAGVDPEEAFASWENLAEASQTIIDNTEAEYGHMIMYGWENLRDMAYSNGGTLVSEDQRTVQFNTPEWVEAWDFARQQIHETETMGVISGGQGWEYWYSTIDEMMSGNAGGYIGSAGDRGDLDFSYIRAMPQPGMNGNEPQPTAGANHMVMSTQNTPEENEAGMAWMQYFTTPDVQAKWVLTTGYVPARTTVTESEAYQADNEEFPWSSVPLEQASYAPSGPEFVDPTGGAISSALTIAADRIELENIPAQEALDEAAETAQEELDAYWEDQE